MVSQNPKQDSILVVDDNPMVVSVLRSLLAAEHFNVLEASNGEEALKALEKESVEVVVCDVMMPRMDGFELHRRVRSKNELAHIPFVFLTALVDTVDVNKALAEGVDDYLVKPFDPEQFLAVVKGKVQRGKTLRGSVDSRYEAYRKRVIHTLSHEFRTPLVAINTGSELLLEQGEQLSQEKIKSLLEAIHRGGQRLERLVSDFMLLQQLEAGVAEKLYNARAEVVDFEIFLKEFLADQQTSLEESGVNLKQHLFAPKTYVKVYAPQLHDAFSRLIQNAIKFSRGVPQIEIALTREDEQAVTEIRDRGMGLDVGRVREALKAFGQIDREKHEQQGGGLGLAIASRFINLHGGNLDVVAREGGGAIVIVRLPIAAI